MMKFTNRTGTVRRWMIAAVPVLFLALIMPFSALAVITNNGAPVYVSTSDSFDPAGATYARIISLKHNGAYNGTLLATFDQLKLVSGLCILHLGIIVWSSNR